MKKYNQATLLGNYKKIFIIGFNKSGTKTLHNFFNQNGFHSIHWDYGKLATKMLQNCIENKKIFNGYDNKYQVFSDMIFLNENIHFEGNFFFKKMDRDYPGSYFIYNHRPIDNWIDSRLNHGQNSKKNSFIKRSFKVYGQDENYIIEKWKADRIFFEKELFAYFKNSKKLLKLNIEDKNINHPALIEEFLGEKLERKLWVWLGKRGDHKKLSLSLKVKLKNFLLRKFFYLK